MVVDSMLKNRKLFLINIGNYQDISVTRQLFAHFWPVKSWSRALEPPKRGLHKASTSTHIASKFQLCTPSGFGVIGEITNF